MIFGIIQGRLSSAPPGQLQCFPQKTWEKEFALAQKLGFDFIELIAEKEHNPRNPLWRDEGLERIKKAHAAHQIKSYVICNDLVMGADLRTSKDAVTQTKALLEQAKKIKTKVMVLPLLEESYVQEGDYRSLISPLREIADFAKEKNILICLETLLNGKALMTLLDQLKNDNIKSVFDTGNRATLGHDLFADIKLLKSRIAHVHIKDKNAQNQNVLLGTGLVNFHQVFEAFMTIGYDAGYSFETTRGSDPVNTARYNRQFVDFFMKDVIGHAR